MKEQDKKMVLPKLDDLFTSQEQRDNPVVDEVKEIELYKIGEFPDHPFRVIDDDKMEEMVKSVKEHGVLLPVIVRKRGEGNYQMISGHRRKRACELAGIDKIKCIVKELTDDEATILMVDSNIQREEKESQQELQKQITIATQDKKVESPKQAEQSKVTQVITKQKTEINEQLKQDIKTETQIQEQTKFETKVEEKQSETPKCTDTNHGVGVGNSNKWFNSYNEAVSYYDNLILSYSNKVHNGEIIFEEYNKQCPCGYEIWSCQYCGKWTLNYYMR
jgi:ParB/RepB/Spo0J family partition protein